jgi:hypothetical protein
VVGHTWGTKVKSFRAYLQCDIRDKQTEKKSDPEDYHWFHQQYIDLLDLRKVLVDIAMESDPRGIRGRVVQKVITKRDCNNNISSRALDASNLENEDCGWYTEEKLDKFALGWLTGCGSNLILLNVLSLSKPVVAGTLGFAMGIPSLTKLGEATT